MQLRVFILSLVSCSLFAANPWAQGSYHVAQSSTVTIPLSIASAVSLHGVGSIACTPNCSAATSVTYTAPTTHIEMPEVLHGCPVINTDDVYAQTVDNLPVHRAQAMWMNNLQVALTNNLNVAPFFVAPDWANGTATANTPLRTFAYVYGGKTGLGINGAPDKGYQLLPYLQVSAYNNPSISPTGRVVIGEAGTWQFPGPGNADQHYGIVQTDNCYEGDVYNTMTDGTSTGNGPQGPNGFECQGNLAYNCNAGGAGFWNWFDYADMDPVSNNMTLASQQRAMPLIIHLEELIKGSINHALRMYLCAGCHDAALIWPSGNAAQAYNITNPVVGGSNCVGGAAGTIVDSAGDSCRPTYGVRFRLRPMTISQLPAASSAVHPNVTRYYLTDGLTATDCSTGGGTFMVVCNSNGTTWTSGGALNKYALMVLKAMTHYGMFITDQGTDFGIAVDNEVYKNPVYSAIGNIGGGPQFGQMDFLDEAGSVTPTNFTTGHFLSEEAYYGGTGALSTPNYAVLDAANSSTTYTVPIALQGITIGVGPSVDDTIVAGASYTFNTWVNGDVQNKGYTWSCVSGFCNAAGGGGSITAGGTYTAPASWTGSATGTQVTAQLQVTSNADSQSFTLVNMHIIPAPSGTVRINYGVSGATQDGFGNWWVSNVGTDIPSPSTINGPNWGYVQQNDNQELNQYSNLMYNHGSDVIVEIMMPNGYYNVRWLTGDHQGKGGTNGIQTDNHDPQIVEVNGQVVMRNWGNQSAEAYEVTRPEDGNFPALVKNGLLEMTVGSHCYAYIPQTSAACNQKAPTFSGLVISPATNTNPFWMLDASWDGQAGLYQKVNPTAFPGGLNTFPPGAVVTLEVVDYGTGDVEPLQQTFTTPSAITYTLNGPGALKFNSTYKAAPYGVPYYETWTAPGIATNQASVVTACGQHHCASITLHTQATTLAAN